MGMMLGLTAWLVWGNGAQEQENISADQLARDFEGLGALGVPEHARLPEPGADAGGQSVSYESLPDSAEFSFAHAETDSAEEASNEPAVIYPEAAATAGPLFPNPLSVPSAQPVQPTQYTAPQPAPASGPAWLTGGIEFEE